MCSFLEELRGRVDKAAATWRPPQALGPIPCSSLQSPRPGRSDTRLCFCAGVAQPATATCAMLSWAVCAQRVMSPKLQRKKQGPGPTAHICPAPGHNSASLQTPAAPVPSTGPPVPRGVLEGGRVFLSVCPSLYLCMGPSLCPFFCPSLHVYSDNPSTMEASAPKCPKPYLKTWLPFCVP